MKTMTKIPRYMRMLTALCLLYFALGSVYLIHAQGEFQAVVAQLQSQLQPKKQGDLTDKKKAFTDKLAKADGIKNFHIATMAETNKLSFESSKNLESSIKSILIDRWQSILKVQSSHSTEIVYVYIRETEQNVELFLVNVEDGEALVMNFQVDPNKLGTLLENRQIFMN